MKNEKIKKGYVMLARQICDSSVMDWPPYYFKLWVWLILKANHTDATQGRIIFRRGELLTTYNEMIIVASYHAGYRLEKPTKTVIRKFLEKLRKEGMVTTRKTIIGLFIKLLNYDHFQTSGAYVFDDEDHNEDPKKTTSQPQKSSTINKNEEKLKEGSNKEKKEDKFILTNKYFHLEDVTDQDFQEIAQHYNVPLNFVKSKYEDMVLWAGQQPNNRKLKGRNWRLTLMTWVKKDALKIMEHQANRKGGVADGTTL